MARALSIKWGTFEVGGSTVYEPTGVLLIDDSEPQGRLECEFLVRGTAAEAATRLADAITAVRKPRQRLLVKNGANTLLDWDPTAASRTAYDARASIEPVDDDASTALGSVYRLVVTTGLVADYAGDEGRRTASLELGRSLTDRRIGVVSGLVTALPNKTARAQYTDTIEAYCQTRLGEIDAAAVWVLTDERSEAAGLEGAEVAFTRVYWEAVDGRRGARVVVEQDGAGIRSFTIIGSYVATPGKTAKQNYDDNEAAHSTATVEALGGEAGKYELERSTIEPAASEQNEHLGFVRVYRELILDQKAGTRNDAEITASTLELVAVSEAPGDSEITVGAGTITASRLVEYRALYTATFEKSVNPRTRWEGGLQTHVLGLIASRLEANSTVLVRKDVRVDPVKNRLVVVLDVIATVAQVVELAETIRIESDLGVRFDPVFAGTDHTYRESRVMATRTKTRTVRGVYQAGGAINWANFTLEDHEGWRRDRPRILETTEKRVGLPTTTITLVTFAIVEEFRLVETLVGRSRATVTFSGLGGSKSGPSIGDAPDAVPVATGTGGRAAPSDAERNRGLGTPADG